MSVNQDIKEKLQEEYSKLSKEAIQLVGKVIDIEKGKLHMLRPTVKDEIMEAINKIIDGCRHLEYKILGSSMVI